VDNIVLCFGCVCRPSCPINRLRGSPGAVRARMKRSQPRADEKHKKCNKNEKYEVMGLAAVCKSYGAYYFFMLSYSILHNFVKRP
jgi:hypothetical protein